jgi:hypothetical protein
MKTCDLCKTKEGVSCREVRELTKGILVSRKIYFKDSSNPLMSTMDIEECRDLITLSREAIIKNTHHHCPLPRSDIEVNQN